MGSEVGDSGSRYSHSRRSKCGTLPAMVVGQTRSKFAGVNSPAVEAVAVAVLAEALIDFSS